MRWIPSQAIPFVQALWRHRWLAVGTAWLVCTAGWIGVAFIPTKYESTARVYLNADPLLTPLLRGLAADTDPGRHLDFMQRTLLSRPNLEQLIRLTDLDTGIRTPAEKEALFKRLASDISVSPITLNLLALSYRDSDPTLAKNIVQSLLTIFAEKMAGSSRAEMDSAQRFLDDEIASYRDQLRAAEKRRSDLAEKYPDIVRNRTPDAPGGDDNGNRLEQARGTVTQLKLELGDVTSKRDAIQKELAAVPTTLTVDHGPQVIVNGGQLTPVEARLQELRRNLDGLLLKYTEEHPDVKAARQAIAQLQAEATKSSSGGAGQLATRQTRDRSPMAPMTKSRSGWLKPKPLSPPCSDVLARPRPNRQRSKRLRSRHLECWCKLRTSTATTASLREITWNSWRGANRRK